MMMVDKTIERMIMVTPTETTPTATSLKPMEIDIISSSPVILSAADASAATVDNVATTAATLKVSLLNLESNNNHIIEMCESVNGTNKEHRKSKKKKRDKRDKDKDKERHHHRHNHNHHHHRERNKSHQQLNYREREHHQCDPHKYRDGNNHRDNDSNHDYVCYVKSASSSPSPLSSSSALSVSAAPLAASSSSMSVGFSPNTNMHHTYNGIITTATMTTTYPHNLKMRFLLSGQRSEMSPSNNATTITICDDSSSGGNAHNLAGATISSSASSVAVSSTTSTSLVSDVNAASFGSGMTSSISTTTTMAISPHKYSMKTEPKLSPAVINLSLSSISKVNAASNSNNNTTAISTSTSNTQLASSSSSSSSSMSGAITTTSSSSSSSLNSIRGEQHHHYHRDERTTPSSTTQPASQAAICDMSNVSNTGPPLLNTPSLYVSVPLSTANNVPGINLPSTTHNNISNAIEQALSSSTRSSAVQSAMAITTSAQQSTAQSLPLTATAATTTSAATIGTALSSTPLERHSPRMLRQSPVVTVAEHAAAHIAETTTLQSTNAHGSSHQNNKSPSALGGNHSSGGNLTATTTENGNLKISYEKQNTRVAQLQEQESTIPTRRSRSRSGESNLSQSYHQQQKLQQHQMHQHHQQQPQQEQHYLQKQQQNVNQKASSRSVRKRAATATATTHLNAVAAGAIDNCSGGKGDHPTSSSTSCASQQSSATSSPVQFHQQLGCPDLFASSSLMTSSGSVPLTMPPPTSVHSQPPIAVVCESLAVNNNNNDNINIHNLIDNHLSNNNTATHHISVADDTVTVSNIFNCLPPFTTSSGAYTSCGNTSVTTSVTAIMPIGASCGISSEKEPTGFRHENSGVVSSLSVGISNSSSCSNSSSSSSSGGGGGVEITSGSLLNKPLNKKLLRAQQTHYQQQQLANQQQQQPHGNFGIQNSPLEGNKTKAKFVNSTAMNIANASNSSSVTSSSATSFITNNKFSSSFLTSSISTTNNNNNTSDINNISKISQQQQNSADVEIVQITTTTTNSTNTNATSTTSTNVHDNAESIFLSHQQHHSITMKSQQQKQQNMTPPSAAVVSSLASATSLSIHHNRMSDSGMHPSSNSAFNINVAANTSPSISTTLSSGSNGLKFTYEPQQTTTTTTMNLGNNTNANTVTAPLELCLSSTTGSGVVATPSQFKDSPPSSPNSEAGSGVSVRKRGRKSKDPSSVGIVIGSSTTASTTTTLASVPVVHHTDLKDVKMLLNGNTNFTITTAVITTSPNVVATASGTSTNTITSMSNILPHAAAAHMLGNQINPNSNVAQKLSDQLHMEIQDHSVYNTPDTIATQFAGVPFPGKFRQQNTATATTANVSNTINNVVNAPGASSLASMFGSSINGNLTIPQSLEQLLERQWEQGSQFLMEQAQHFDIASLLSCLHQLQTENVRLEEHVTSLIARRDHLLAVNARLAIPLNSGISSVGGGSSNSTTGTSAQSQASIISSIAVPFNITYAPPPSVATVGLATISTPNSIIMATCTSSPSIMSCAISTRLPISCPRIQQQQQQHLPQEQPQHQHYATATTKPINLENIIDSCQSSTTAGGSVDDGGSGRGQINSSINSALAASSISTSAISTSNALMVAAMTSRLAQHQYQLQQQHSLHVNTTVAAEMSAVAPSTQHHELMLHSQSIRGAPLSVHNEKVITRADGFDGRSGGSNILTTNESGNGSGGSAQFLSSTGIGRGDPYSYYIR